LSVRVPLQTAAAASRSAKPGFKASTVSYRCKENALARKCDQPYNSQMHAAQANLLPQSKALGILLAAVMQ
jgi:hypothetical protein